MGKSLTIKPTGGMVTRTSRNLLDQDSGTFQKLLNCRLSENCIEQTRHFVPPTGTFLHSRGSYYSGGVQTEPDDNMPALLLWLSEDNFANYFWASQYGAYRGQLQLQVLWQTVYPATETINTCCLLVVNDYTALGLTLGQTLDVEIEVGGATFKWRKNGGAYTLAQPCSTSGTSIDGGNATVYFLAATGNTVADVWSWTRTDWLGEIPLSSNFISNWSYAIYGTRIYFVGYTGRVFVYENGGIRTIGYRPVYGSHVAFFQEHLFVANYFTNYAFSVYSGVSANSDLNNFESFILTDLSEADQYLIPVTIVESENITKDGIRGYYLKDRFLYVITSTSIWTVSYFGLPTVFKYDYLRTLSVAAAFHRPVITPDCAYIVCTNGIFAFNGSTLVEVSQKLKDHYDIPTATVFPFTLMQWGAYDSTRKEVYFLVAGNNIGGPVNSFLVYQETTQSYYFRAANFTSFAVRSMCVFRNRIVIGYILGVALESLSFGQSTGLPDNTPNYQVPTIETQDITLEEIEVKHEINQLYLDAYYDTTIVGPYSSTGVAIDVAVREYTQGPVTFSSSPVATWTRSGTDGQLSYRGSARIFRFRIRATATSTSVVAKDFVFNRLVLTVLNHEKKEVRR